MINKIQPKRRPLPIRRSLKTILPSVPTEQDKADMVSALVNLGVKRKDAKERVDILLIQMPTGKLEDYLIRLLRGLKVSA